MSAWLTFKHCMGLVAVTTMLAWALAVVGDHDAAGFSIIWVMCLLGMAALMLTLWLLQ